MGQKANPILVRLGIKQQWRSRWFSGKKDFGVLLAEDMAIRQYVKKQLENAGIADIIVERYANRVRINIYTARPGIVIGRRGADIERIRAELSERTGKEVYLEIHEVKDPDANAQLVAENIALQLSRRISHKRAMKQAIALAMAQKNVEGIKIRVAGRLGGAELARAEWYKEGKLPLHTFSANVEYGFAESDTKAGRIGVKVWICKKKDNEQKEIDKR